MGSVRPIASTRSRNNVAILPCHQYLTTHNLPYLISLTDMSKPMDNTTIQCGILGLGNMGKLYAKCFHELPFAGVAALCDTSADALKETSALYPEAKAYTTVRELLNHPGLDAVCIAIPDYLHFAPARAALEKEKHIICEKPLTTDLSEADKLLELVDKAPVKFLTAYSNRWVAPYNHVFQSIQEGKIGDPLMAYARKNDTLSVATKLISWADKSSPCYFLNAHDIDMVRWCFQSEPKEVHAYGIKKVLVKKKLDTYDLIQAQVQFKNGTFATFESGWIYPNTYPTIVEAQLEIVGSDGVLQVDRKAECLELTTHESFSMPKTMIGGTVFGKSAGAHKLMCEHFIDIIRNDGTPFVSAFDGRQVTAVLDAVHESIEKKQSVKVR